MTLVKEPETIPITTLIEYHKVGFKLVPLSRDSNIPNVHGLLTSEEEKRSREESTDDQGHPVNYIYNHPEFWTEDRVKKEHWRFNNVATTFGKTHLTDEKGAPLYLNVIDIDSKQVYDNLAIIRFDDKDRYFIDEMCKVTSVTQTRKKWGRHIYWLSHKQYQSIRTKECKVGCEFEIKTDNSTGLSTLPESIHRDDPNFHYQSIGRDVILVQDSLYDGLVKELTDSLRQNSDRNVGDNSENYDHDNIAIINNNNRISLAEPDISDMIAHLGHFYQNGIRDGNSRILFDR